MKAASAILIYILVMQAIAQTTTTTSQKVCPFGNFLTSKDSTGQCVQCLSSCSKCKDLDSPCEGCSEGYKLSSNLEVCQPCEIGQLKCDKKETTCQRYYRIENGECKPRCLLQNCKICSSIFTQTCTQCNSQFKINNEGTACNQAQIRVSGGKRILQTSTTSTTSTSSDRLSQIISNFGSGSGSSSSSTNTASTFTPLDPNKLINALINGGSFDTFATPQIDTSGFSALGFDNGLDSSSSSTSFQSSTTSSTSTGSTGTSFGTGTGSTGTAFGTGTGSTGTSFGTGTGSTGTSFGTGTGSTGTAFGTGTGTGSTGTSFGTGSTGTFTSFGSSSNSISSNQTSTSTSSSSSSTSSPGITTTTTTVITETVTNSSSNNANTVPITPVVIPNPVPVVVPPIVVPVINQTVTTNSSSGSSSSTSQTSSGSNGNTISNNNGQGSQTVLPPTPTPIVPTPIPIPPAPINRICTALNEYDDPVLGCTKCGSKCATCINFADQCLECAADRFKMGWKCVTKEYIRYNLSLAIPDNVNNSYLLGNGINDIKTNFKNFIMPTAYIGSDSNVLTLLNLVVDPKLKLLNLTGVLDKVSSIPLVQLNKTIGANLKASKKIGQFPLVSSTVNAFPNDAQIVTVNGTTVVATIVPKSTPPPAETSNSNLVPILVPSIIGGLGLLGCIIGLCCCYNQKTCCWKNKISGNQNGQLTSRPFKPGELNIDDNIGGPIVNYPGSVYVVPNAFTNAAPPADIPPPPSVRATPIVNINPPKTATTQFNTGINTNTKITQVVNNTNIVENVENIIQSNQNTINPVPIVNASNTKYFYVDPKNEQVISSNNMPNLSNQLLQSSVGTSINTLTTVTAKPIQPITYAYNPIINTNTSALGTTTLSNNNNNSNTDMKVTAMRMRNQEQSVGSSGTRIIQTTRTIQETKPLIISNQANNVIISKVANNNNGFAPTDSRYYQEDRKISSSNSIAIGQVYPINETYVIHQEQPTVTRVVLNETISSPVSNRVISEQRTETMRSMSPSQKTVQLEGNSYLGAITKHSFKNGKLVTEQIQSGSGGDFSSNKSIQYRYAEDELKNANANFVRREEELRTLGIKNLTNQAQFYVSPEWTYETKK